ncbi:hypothetical protein LEMA_P095640.1 [Plenodomus lingam JN3]|uniref:Secreted protein n=2 Tax=Leptosphaeria maculans TaxID=5022 RepID=E5A3E2_LEPMJ|nr:hypothetical protein LEMA_P095640.1 [Plenodomus lingam JN3]CBX98155.1 hypothetical protein LEMA_P095640.1 [Plenodomus lingam JN3]
MRYLVLAVSLPVAYAAWVQNLCSGVGGCTYIGGSPDSDPYRCPDGSAITIPNFLTDLAKTGQDGATPVSKADFPAKCSSGAVPGPNDKLVSTRNGNGQTIFAFLKESCTETKPEAPGNCYAYRTNPTTYNFCSMVDASRKECTPNPQAGRCERWGNTVGRIECEGWKIGMKDYPDTQ